jgi:hypothetical protein
MDVLWNYHIVYNPQAAGNTERQQIIEQIIETEVTVFEGSATE